MAAIAGLAEFRGGFIGWRGRQPWHCCLSFRDLGCGVVRVGYCRDHRRCGLELRCNRPLHLEDLGSDEGRTCLSNLFARRVGYQLCLGKKQAAPTFQDAGTADDRVTGCRAQKPDFQIGCRDRFEATHVCRTRYHHGCVSHGR